MLADIRLALRAFRHAPGFSALAVLILALGAGANASVFSVVRAVLVEPLPYARPDRLVAIWPDGFISNADLEFMRARTRSFAHVASSSPGWTMSMIGAGDPVRVTATKTSANIFAMLGAAPLAGRTFAPGEDRPGRHRVIILSHALWQSRFGGDARAIGRIVTVEDAPHEVIGVMRPDFELLGRDAELWMPLPLDITSPFYKGTVSQAIARLRDGVELAAAEREISSLVPDWQKQLGYEKDWGKGVVASPLQDVVVGDVRRPLLVLIGAVGLIVLLTAANLGTLLLGRHVARRGEMAIRSALGASAWHLARLTAVESACLALAGAAAGILLARATLPALVRLLPPEMPRVAAIDIDPVVLGVVLAVSVASVLACGVLPSMLVASAFGRKSSPSGVASAFLGRRSRISGEGGRRKSGFRLPAFAKATARSRRSARVARGGGQAEVLGRHTETRSGRRALDTLVVGQVALAIVLGVGAALMVRSLMALQRVHPGFEADHVLTLKLQPTGERYRGVERTVAYYRQVMDRVAAVPGVTRVAAINHLPLSGYNWVSTLRLDEQPLPAGVSPPRVGWRMIDGPYFDTMGIPLRAGRVFDERDGRTAPPVTIVNEALARKFFGSSKAAVGRTVRTGSASGEQTPMIVGVVGDVRHIALARDPQPEMYRPFSQSFAIATAIVVRTAGSPGSATAAVRQAVWAVDPNMPIADLLPLPALLRDSLGRPRLVATLLLVFAIVGLAIVTSGVYGVVAYTVRRREREMGIRLALGAAPASVSRLVIRQGVGYALAGLAIGAPSAVGAAGLLRGQVFGIQPRDPATIVWLCALIAGTTVAATILPALRARRVDPAAVLKSE